MKITLEDGTVLTISEESYKALQQAVREPNNGRWTPELGEPYWFNRQEKLVCYYNNTTLDKNIISSQPLFKTEEEAQEYLDFTKIMLKYSHKFSVEELKDDNIKKWYVYYFKRDLLVRGNYTDISEHYLFKTKEQVEKCIDELTPDMFLRNITR